MPCPRELFERISVSFVGDGGKVILEHLLTVDNGAYLEQVERARAVIVELGSKLYLYRTAHLSLPILLHQAQDVRQREHIVLGGHWQSVMTLRPPGIIPSRMTMS